MRQIRLLGRQWVRLHLEVLLETISHEASDDSLAKSLRLHHSETGEELGSRGSRGAIERRHGGCNFEAIERCSTTTRGRHGRKILHDSNFPRVSSLLPDPQSETVATRCTEASETLREEEDHRRLSFRSSGHEGPVHDRARGRRLEGIDRKAYVAETVQDHLDQVSGCSSEEERHEGTRRGEDALASVRRGGIEQIVFSLGRDSHHGQCVREGKPRNANVRLLRCLRWHDENHGA